MERRLVKKTGVRFLVVVLATILVSGGLLAACSRTQTSTATTATTSATSTTTTVKPTATSTAAMATTSATSTATQGSAAASFYRDNVVTIIVPYVPGGVTDYAARLFAYYWPEVTGGRMIVENKDGAAGLIGVNYAYAAKPDGLTIGEGIMDSSLLTPVLAQNPAVKFDLKKMNWIEYTNPGNADALGISPKLPYTSMADFSKAKGLKFGCSGTTGSSLGTALLIELFGLSDARIVVGYGGAAETQLAVAKGEVDAYTMNGATIMEGVGKGLNKQPFVSLGFERSPYFPDVPSIPELLKLSPEQENLLRTYTSLRGGQVFWFQPGVPQDKIDFVRNAFDKIVALEDFKKQSALKWVYVKPVGGKDLAAEMEKTVAVVTPERFKQLQLLVDKYVR